jgi:site-specific recombinase XerD
MTLTFYFILTRRGIREPKPPRRRGSTAGLTEDPAAFLARHTDVADLLRKGKSLRCVQAVTGKARNTVIKVRRMIQP